MKMMTTFFRMVWVVASLALLAVCPEGAAQETGGPVLLAPAAGAVLPNGNRQRTVEHVWEFVWKPVPGATAYELFVMSDSSQVPMIQEEVAEPRYRHVSNSYTLKLKDWKWMVRAKVQGNWQTWSSPRPFEVSPILP